MNNEAIVGYAHYPSGLCKPIIQANPKLRGFKIMGERPHKIVLFTDEIEYFEGARTTVNPYTGEIFKAGSVWKSAQNG